VALAQWPGTFTATGSMTAPRAEHTATLLPDGKVLIGGGELNAGTLASAELYDPATGTFARTGDMVSAHACHQATLLRSGEVLITGGSGAQGVPSGELYDPVSGTFTAAGPYISNVSGFNSCQGATSTLLSNGKVLIVWEEPNDFSKPLGAAAELYDPDNGTFSQTGPMTGFDFNDGLPTATLLMNGGGLITGGADDTGVSTRAELYDHSTGTFADTGSMSTPHSEHTAMLLPDGTVLIVGGYLFGGATVATTELYDPVSGTFSTGREMVTSRCCHTATLLNDGRVLIAGGNTAISTLNSGSPTPLAELYTPEVLTPAPVLLSTDGRGQGAILHAGTARLVTASDPAVEGEGLEIYCTGLAEGSAIPRKSPWAADWPPSCILGMLRVSRV
jgi:hypothetical protein